VKSKRHAGFMIPGALAAGGVAALFCAILIAGLAIRSACAQTVATPTFNPYAKSEVKQPDATTVPKTSWPVLPHETLMAPLPKKPGCFHLVDDSWREVPCTPNEVMKNLPHPVIADTIQSTAHINGNASSTTPLEWGAVATWLTNPEQSGETEEEYVTSDGKTTLNKYPDTFSIQANTNRFTCSTCQNGYPFPESMPGDAGWVQFVYQQSGDDSGEDTVSVSELCIWLVDSTVACKDKTPHNGCQGNGYQSFCVSPFTTGNLYPLTGSGSSSGFSEVVGYIQCGNTSNAWNVGANGCTLWILGYLANAQNPGWWASSAPDTMGLAGTWTSVGGSLYGMANAAEAVFTNATLNTNVVANSCYTSSAPPSNPGSIFAPTQCSTGLTKDDLTATLAATHGNGTGEYNNLTSGAAIFSCTEYDCRLGWVGTTNQFTTQTSVSSNETPSFYGDSVTFTAAVTSPGGTPSGGTVQFVVDGNNFGSPAALSGGSAAIQETSLPVGTHTVRADYTGYSTFASSSGTLPSGQTVNQQQTHTRVSSSEDPSYYGDTVTLTASVSDRDDTLAVGTMQFVVDGTNFGSPVTLSSGSAGIKETVLSAKNHTVTANYSGDENHLASSGDLQGGQTVNKQQTDTKVGSSEDPSSYGDTVTFTATVSDRDDTLAGGTIQFAVDGTNFGSTVTLSGDSASVEMSSLSAGDHAVTARYSGDDNHLASNGHLYSGQTVNKQQTVTRVVSSENPSIFGTSITFTAAVNDRDNTIAGGTVQFVVSGKNFGGPVTLSGGNAGSQAISSFPAGSYTVTANYSGDENHLPGSGDLHGGQTVNKAATTTAVTSSEDPSNPGDSVTFYAGVSGPGGYPTGNVQFKVDDNNLGNPVPVQQYSSLLKQLNYATSPSTSTLSSGNHIVTANYLGDGNYEPSSNTLSERQFVRYTTSTTVTSSENPSIYGDSVTFTAFVVGTDGHGTVQFLVDQSDYGPPVSLSLGQFTGRLPFPYYYAALKISDLQPGTHSILAKYSGDDDFTASSGTLSGGQTVKAQTTTSVSSSEGP
jgi:hypothetical protein